MSVSPNRVLVVILGTVGVLVVVAVVAIALRPPATFDPATPEGAVQGYLEAVFDEDESTAVGYLEPKSPCDERDISDASVDNSARVVLVDTEVDGDTARVEVEVTFSRGQGPFDSYEYSQNESFDLVDSGNRWLLTGEPWPVHFCRGDDQ